MQVVGFIVPIISVSPPWRKGVNLFAEVNMKMSEKLKLRILKDLNIDLVGLPSRVYGNQSGTLSWHAYSKCGKQYKSYDSMYVCVNCDVIQLQETRYDNFINVM